MTTWLCDTCTTAYSVGAPRCPHCGSSDWHEEGTPPPELPVEPAADAEAPSIKAGKRGVA